MPRFFFDFVDEQGEHSDPEGVPFADLDAAETEVARTLPRLAAEKLAPRGGRLGMHVRDDRGHSVLTAVLHLAIQRT